MFEVLAILPSIIYYDHPSIAPIGPTTHGWQRFNSWMAAIVLEDLGIHYTTKSVSDVKSSPCIGNKSHWPVGAPLLYTCSLNGFKPLPAMEGPNTKATLWEQGAITEYLVENCNKASKLTVTTTPGRCHVK